MKTLKYIAAVIAAAVMLSSMPFSAMAEEGPGVSADEVVDGAAAADEAGNADENSGDGTNENESGGGTGNNGDTGENEGDGGDNGGNNDPVFSGGDGSVETPYLISSAAELKALADAVNGGNDYNGMFFDLTADIDLSKLEGKWTPIGAYYNDNSRNDTPFSGTLDGKRADDKGNYAIKGLNVDNTSKLSEYSYGLFGYVKGGTVKNIDIPFGYVGGKNNTGVIAGYNDGGTIENCTVGGGVNVQGSDQNIGGIVGYNAGTVRYCENSGNIGKDSASCIGGIVGYNASSVIDCTNSGSVSGTVGSGGIAGDNSGTVTGCHNTGNIGGGSNSGGIAGSSSSTIEKSYNSGEVSGTSNVGGITGDNNGKTHICYNEGNVTGDTNVGGVVGSENSNTTENCYNLGAVRGTGNVGGVAGSVSGKVVYCYNIGTVTTGGGVAGSVTGTGAVTNCWYLSDTAAGGIGSADTDGAKALSGADLENEDTFKDWASDGGVWVIVKDTKSGLIRPVFVDSTENNIMPIEPVWSEFDGAGTEKAPYRIYGLDELKKLRDHVNEGYTGYDKHFRLENDIDMSSVRNWTPIGVYVKEDPLKCKPFAGTFDGNKKVISGMSITSKDSGNNGYGLFGYNNGTIRYLGVVDGSIDLLDKADDIGGIAGYNGVDGTIEYCYNYGCNVSGRDRIGGIVGNNPGTVRICFSTGDIKGTWGSAGGIAGDNGGMVENCYNTGDIESGKYVGGVVGYNSAADSTAGTVRNAYSVGKVTGDSDVCGVVGFLFSGKIPGKIENCFYLDDTADFGVGGDNKSDIGAVPIDKEQFNTRSIFTIVGWDFNNIWIMSEKLGRPIFGKEVRSEEELTPDDTEDKEPPENEDPPKEDDPPKKDDSPKDDDPPKNDPPVDQEPSGSPYPPSGSWQRPGAFPFVSPGKDTSSADADDDDVSSGAGFYEDSVLMDGLSYAGIGILLISIAGALAVIIRKRIKSSK
ncbi:MAG: hypothetical protein J1F11_02265 [Oscillospiraceae bacterium]|nr:hypothetical protein [Oscillospiraceae bacterium]